MRGSARNHRHGADGELKHTFKKLIRSFPPGGDGSPVLLTMV
jgi:hypothetical protein